MTFFACSRTSPWTSTSQYVLAERTGKLSTDDTTTTTLSDHLLRSILIAQHRAASIDGHLAVKVLDGRYAALNGCVLGTNFVTYYPETTDKSLFPHLQPSSSTL